MQVLDIVTFQDAATATGYGTAHAVGSANQVAIYVTRTGDASTSTVNFAGKDVDGNWYAVYATLQVDGSKATSTEGKDECWIIDTTPWVEIRTGISAISEGEDDSVTVKGRFVNTAA